MAQSINTEEQEQAFRTFAALMVLLLAMVACIIAALITLRLRHVAQAYLTQEVTIIAEPVALSPIFTPEVQYWASDIKRWSEVYGLDPDMVATIMQIESCGNPVVASPAGAQGLFQVCEMTWQLRGQSGARQVPEAKLALGQTLGLGGNASAVVLKK